ncbi:hypothetical protein PDJAM_G00156840 [Pangasius djambal]|uniref:Uncharacterized protein n=1 Tax=Pangasius djambal TaxID=1691987 RepID=A0ACC5ZJA5_9TELE|nr:hypothetical protein [Pangasius djambal]
MKTLRHVQCFWWFLAVGCPPDDSRAHAACKGFDNKIWISTTTPCASSTRTVRC